MYQALNDAALDRLMSAYLDMRTELVRFLTARLGSHAAAEDIYQELFLRLRAARPQANIENLRGFIFRSAYNLANEHARAGQRRSKRDAAWSDLAGHKLGPESVADEPPADDAIDSKRKLEDLMAGLADLTPKSREVFVLHHLKGQSHRDIADGLGISVKAVEKQMTLALKSLAARLGIVRLRH